METRTEDEYAAQHLGVERITGDVDNVVAGTEPHVHTGSGPQFNGPAYLVSEITRRIRAQRTSRTLTAELLKHLSDRFVEPRGFDKAKQHLETTGIVLVSGQAGSGRRSAALMSLHESSPSGPPIRVLPTDVEDAEDSSFDPDSIRQGEPLFIDISGEDQPDRLRSAQDRLETLRPVAERRGALLAVVLPPQSDHWLHPDFARLKVDIGRPYARRVLATHLGAGGIEVNEATVDLHVPKPLLARARMRDLDQLSQLIVKCRDGDPYLGLSEWIKRACVALSEHSAKVASNVLKWNAPQRAWALSAAMLQDSHADSVHLAATLLLRQLEFPEDEKHLLERDGLDTVLKTIDVTTDESRQIAFTSLGYEDAVRDHFWTNYPDMREPLRDWIGECIATPGFSHEDRKRLVDRLAEQACRTNRVMDLCALAYRWTHQDRSSTQPHWAENVLVHGLRYDRSLGGAASEIRRKIYDWVSQSRLSTDLARVLVVVCAGEVAETKPEQAAVRLRRLYRRREPEVAAAARTAITDLAADPRFLRRLLFRMDDWLRPEPKLPDVELFLAISDPHRLVDTSGKTSALIDSHQVRQQLSAGWKSAFVLKATGWPERAAEWLMACRSDPRGGKLIDVLVAACDRELSRFANLYVIARDWAFDATDREERALRMKIFRSLNNKLDDAQGLRFRNSGDKEC